MLRRIIISVILIPVIIYIIHEDFLASVFLFCFILLLSFFGSMELYNLLKSVYGLEASRYAPLLAYLPGLILITAYYLNIFFKPASFSILYIIAGCGLILFISTGIRFRLRNRGLHFLVNTACYIYTGIFPLSILILKQEADGTILIYLLFFLGWLNDALAYFIGSFLGRTRGIIKYSPNKSLEGYLGSFILTIGAVIGLRLLFMEKFPFDLTQSVVVGLVFSVCAPAGDIVESIVKRKAGLKDSSKFLPGLGGVLDIFDSILMTAPFYYVVLKFIFKL